MPRADNMIAILMLLRAKGRMTARQLAEELEVHIRTVYRCIDALCASGMRPRQARTAPAPRHAREAGRRKPDAAMKRGRSGGVPERPWLNQKLRLTI